MNGLRSALVAAALAGAVASPGLSAPRLGDEFQVNSYTTSAQDSAAVARSGADFVVVWRSEGSGGDDDDSTSIQAQRYSGADPLGAEFQVNSYITSGQRRPAVAMTTGGGFVVVWDSDGSASGDTSSRSVQAQRYDSAAIPLGSQFQVNSYTTAPQTGASVATDASGNFVVVWESFGSAYGDTSSRSIQGQRFDPSGVAAGGQFQVNATAASDQYGPDVARAGAGAFVVVWSSGASAGDDSSGRSIQGQRFDASGNAAGSEFQVNSYTTNDQINPAIAMDPDGDFVVSWSSDGGAGTDATGDSIQAQRYDASGNPLGAQFQVNELTTSAQITPDVSTDALGNFVISWGSNSSIANDDASYSVQAQRFRADGSPLLGQFQVNRYTTSFQEFPAIASNAGGDFVVIWQSAGSHGSDSSSLSVQGQRYAAPREVPLLSAPALLVLVGMLLAGGSALLRSQRG